MAKDIGKMRKQEFEERLKILSTEKMEGNKMDILQAILNEDEKLQKAKDKISAMSDEMLYEGLFYYIRKYGFELTGNVLDSSLPEPDKILFLTMMAMFEAEYRKRKEKRDGKSSL